jgi:YD repeat-containing protein
MRLPIDAWGVWAKLGRKVIRVFKVKRSHTTSFEKLEDRKLFTVATTSIRAPRTYHLVTEDVAPAPAHALTPEKAAALRTDPVFSSDLTGPELLAAELAKVPINATTYSLDPGISQATIRPSKQVSLAAVSVDATDPLSFLTDVPQKVLAASDTSLATSDTTLSAADSSLGTSDSLLSGSTLSTDTSTSIMEPILPASLPPTSTALVFQGQDDADNTLALDLSALPQNPDKSPVYKYIVYNGGHGGYNTLAITGGHFSHEIYITTGPDSGILRYDGTTVIFTGLSPVYDFTRAYSYQFYDANFNHDTINVDDGGEWYAQGGSDYGGDYGGEDGYGDGGGSYYGYVHALHIYDPNHLNNSSFEEVYVGNKDNIGVSGAGENTINLLYSQAPTALNDYGSVVYGAVSVQAGSGTNTIDATQLPQSAGSPYLFGTYGNDTFRLSRTHDTSLYIYGGSSGTKTLDFADASEGGAFTYSISNTWVNNTFYSGIQTLAIHSGGSPTFNVLSQDAGTTLNLYGSGTANAISTFNIGSSASYTSLNYISGTIHAYGGNGATNNVTVDDWYGSAGTYTMSASAISRTGSTASISYSGVQNLTLDTSNSSSTVNLSAAAAGTTVNLRGGGGGDTFNVGGAGTGTLDPILGTMTIDGGSGTNTVNVDDQLANSGIAYTLANGPSGSASLARTTVGNAISVGISNIQTLNAYASGNTSFLVTGTGSSLTAVTLTGGIGDNTYTFAASASTTLAPLSIGTPIFAGENYDLEHDTIDFSGLSPSPTGTGANGATLDLGVSSPTQQNVTRDGRLHLKLVNPNRFVTVIGSSGDDRIWGNGRDNYLSAGAGDDYLYGVTGNDTLVAGSGTDYLYGGTTGSGYTDTLIAGSGNGQLTGGVGSNVYVFDPSQGALGHITVNTNASAPSDTLDFSAFAADQPVTVDVGLASLEQFMSPNMLGLRLSTTTGITKVIGGAGTNTITGNSRGDQLYGGSGTNTLYAVSGNNTLVAGSGPTTMYAGIGTDELDGGSGDDIFVNGSGTATFVGGTANNTYRLDPARGLGIINITTDPAAPNDTLDFTAFGTNQPVQVDIGSIAPQPVYSTMSLKLSSDTGISNVIGGSGANIIWDNARDNHLYGGSGDNELHGVAGNNTLVTGIGTGHTNTLFGGAGNDTFIIAGSETANITGGSGDNTYVFDPTQGSLGSVYISTSATAPDDTLDFSAFASGQGLTLYLSSGGSCAAIPTFSLSFSNATGISNVIGGDGDDQIYGNSRDNRLIEHHGNNYLRGGGVQSGYSPISGLGGDQLFGGDGNDNLGLDPSVDYGGGYLGLIEDDGGDNNNVYAAYGGAYIVLGSGQHTVQGGGHDTYVFKPGGTANDTISEQSNPSGNTFDFSAFQSNITLDLNKLDSQAITDGLTITMPYYGVQYAIGGSGINNITGDGTGGGGGAGSSPAAGDTYPLSLDSTNDVATVATAIDAIGQSTTTITVTGSSGTTVTTLPSTFTQIAVTVSGAAHNHRIVLESLANNLAVSVTGSSAETDSLLVIGSPNPKSPNPLVPYNADVFGFTGPSASIFSLTRSSNGISGGTYTFSGIANLTVDGRGYDVTQGLSKADTLTINGTANAWQINGSQFSQSGYPNIVVQNIGNVVITHAGNVTVQADAPGTSNTSINSISIQAPTGVTNTVTVNGTISADTLDIAVTNSLNTVIANGGPMISLTSMKLTINADGANPAAGAGGDDTIRVSSWSGSWSNLTIAAGNGTDTVDLSGNNLSAGALPSMSGADNLVLSRCNLSSVPTLPTGLTSLDLRYNQLNLASYNSSSTPHSAIDAVASESQLSQLYLYGNPGTTAVSPPDLQALKGMLLRVDLAPIGLQQAESVFNVNGSIKSLDDIEKAIVKSLHYLPLEIYDYVHNNYAFQLYRGAMKGTLGVIETHAGNDLEQAQLLKSLLDQLQAGITTTLVWTRANGQGGLVLDRDSAEQWIGVRTPAAVLEAIGQANVNHQWFTSTGNNIPAEMTYIAVDHAWLQASLNNGATILQLDPSWKLKSLSAGDQRFLDQYNLTTTPHGSFKSVGEIVAKNLTPSILDPANNPYYQNADEKQLASEWFEDRVAEFLSQNNGTTINGITLPALTLADLKYDGPIQPILTTRAVLPSVPGLGVILDSSNNFVVFTNQMAIGISSSDLASETWKLNLTLAYTTDPQPSDTSVWNTVESLPLNVPDVSLRPVELIWDTTNRTAQFSALNTYAIVVNQANQPAGTTTSLGTSSPIATNATKVRLSIAFTEAGGTQGSLDTPVNYDRSPYTDLTIGLEANQENDQFVNSLQSIATSDASGIIWNNPGLFGQKQITDLLALAANRFFSRTDQAQSALDGLFHTEQVFNQIAAGVVSSDSTTPTFYPDLPNPYVPNNMLLDVRQFRAQAVSIDRTTVSGIDTNITDDTEQNRFGLIGAAMSSEERGVWEELANSHAMSTVKSFQIAKSSGITIDTIIVPANMTGANYLASSAWVGTNGEKNRLLVSGVYIQEINAIESFIRGGAKRIVTPTSQTSLDSWNGIGFLAETDIPNFGISSLAWIIVDSNGVAHGGVPVAIQPVFTPPNYLSGDIGDPIDAATGAVLDDTTDISIPTNGLPLTFTRHYDSSTIGDPAIGKGWWGSYSDVLTFNPDGTTTWTNSQGNQLKFTNPPAGSNLYGNPDSIFGEMRQITNGDGSKDIVFRDKSGLSHTFWWHTSTGGNQSFIGKLRSISDLNGNSLTVNRYTTSGAANYGLVSSVVASNSMKLSFVYSSDGTLQSITSSESGASRTWLYAVYQGVISYQNCSITNGSTTVTTTDSTFLRPGMIIEGSGIPVRTRITAVNGTTITISNPATATNSSDLLDMFDWVLHEVQGPTDPTTGVSTVFDYAYNTASLPRTVGLLQSIAPIQRKNGIDTALGAVTHTYYPNGRSFQTVDPEGNVQTYQYNTYRNRTTFTDENNHDTLYDFDLLGRQVRVTYPDRSSELDSWGAPGSTDAGLHLTHTDPLGKIANYIYGATNAQVLTGSTTVNTPNVSVSSTSNLGVGMTIVGQNIPAGAVITQINSSTTITISSLATGTGPNIQLTFLFIHGSPTDQNHSLGNLIEADVGAYSNLSNSTDPNHWSQPETTARWTQLYVNDINASGGLVTAASHQVPLKTVYQYDTERDNNALSTSRLHFSKAWHTSPPSAISQTNVTINGTTTTVYSRDTFVKYDSRGNPITAMQAVADPTSGGTIKYQYAYNYYTPQGLPSTTVDPRYEADFTTAFSNSLFTTPPTGQTGLKYGTNYTYNSFGLPTSIQQWVGTDTSNQPVYSTQTNRYDGHGFLASQVDPDGSTTSASLGGSTVHTTMYVNDVLGHRVSTIQPAADPTVSPHDSRKYFDGTTVTTYQFSDATLDNNRSYVVLVKWVAASGKDASATLSVTAGSQTTPVFSNKVNTNLATQGFTDTTGASSTNWMIVGAFQPLGGKLTVKLAPHSGATLNAATLRILEVGPVTSATYDAFGDVIQSTDAEGRVALSTFDRHQRLVDTRVFVNSAEATANYPAVSEIGTVYDPAGNIVAQTDGNGNFIRLVYDNRNRAVETILPNGPTSSTSKSAVPFTTATYNGLGEITSQTDADFNQTLNTYDQLGQLVRVQSPFTGFAVKVNGNYYFYDSGTSLMTYQYDAAGNRITASLTTVENETAGAAVDRTTQYFYDSLDRLVKQIDPAPDSDANPDQRTPIHLFTYDAAGNLRTSTVTTKATGGLAEETMNLYDGLGRLTDVTEVDGNSTTTILSHKTFAYDAAGNLTNSTITFAGVVGGTSSGDFSKDQKTTYRYDNLNRRIEEVDPLPGTGDPQPDILFQYDRVGNLTQQTLKTHHATKYVYDALNRRTQVIQADDPAGNWFSSTRNQYDSAGNLLAVVTATAVLAADVQNAARTETTRYSYDNRNRRIRTINALGAVSSVDYDGNSNVIQETDANGNISQHYYDTLNREVITILPSPTTGQIANDSPVKVSLFNTPAGDLETTFFGTYTNPYQRQTDYQYDKLHRLVKTTLPIETADPANPSYVPARAATTTTYDVFGNVKTAFTARRVDPTDGHLVDDDGGRTKVEKTAYTYDLLNRLTSKTESDISATPSVQPRTTVFAYDAAGNLVMQELQSQNTAINHTEFAYDALNRQIEERYYGTTASTPAETTPYHLYDPATTSYFNHTQSHYDVAGNLTTFTGAFQVRTFRQPQAASRSSSTTPSIARLKKSTSIRAPRISSRPRRSPGPRPRTTRPTIWFPRPSSLLVLAVELVQPILRRTV